MGALARTGRRNRSLGFTLVELMIVIAILTTLAALAVPMYGSARETAHQMVAIRELQLLQREVDLYLLRNRELPAALTDVQDYGNLTDPWGKPYQYLRFEDPIPGGKGKGKKVPEGSKRKNLFLVPLNSSYDLYSMGPDGKSVSPLTAEASRDDIVRANDGDFIGLASKY